MATNEKDRFGDKLREAERAREDVYFEERDRALLEKLKREKESAAESKAHQEASMRCPKCGVRLEQAELNGVKVDECPSCRGMWLDHGELKELGVRESEGWVARWLRREFGQES